MNKFIIAKSGLAIVFTVFLFSLSFGSKKNLDDRNIYIAGLVINAETLSPLSSAKISDSDNNILGTTDKNGYFNISINYTKSGELDFRFKITKQGFQAFSQHDHWADISGDTKQIMYFGLRASNTNVKSFSTFANNSLKGNDLSYNNVYSNFDKVRTEKEFDAKLANAKAGNQNVLIQIDSNFYIVDQNGWIKIDYDKDSISLNNQKVLAADKLNSAIKRKDIKRMTPLNSKEEKFAIYTR